MPQWQFACNLNELSSDFGHEVVVEGKPIAIFHVEGRVFALQGVCRNGAGRLSNGVLEGSFVTCPQHGCRFDVTSGRLEDDPTQSQPTISVRVNGAEVEVDVDGSSEEIPAEENSDPRVVPDTIDRFKVKAFLDGGAFGDVFVAYDPELDRKVTLKMPRGKAMEPAERTRFMRGAQAATKLKHPNIIRVTEVVILDDGVPVIVSDYVEGREMRLAIGNQPMGESDAVELIQQLAITIDYAHRKGVIHRDLKPANIVIDDEGRPHVLDFGVAYLEGEERVTRQNEVVGSSQFLPPEQVDGSNAIPTAQNDIYGLGAIFFLLLTGRHVYEGNEQQIYAQLLSRRPSPRPRQVEPSVARSLDLICSRCLEKDPKHRYASAADLADELERFKQGQPLKTRPRGFVRGLMSSVRRHVVPIVIVAMSLLIIFLLWQNYTYRQKNEKLMNTISELEVNVSQVNATAVLDPDDINGLADEEVLVDTSEQISFITKYAQDVVRFGNKRAKSLAAATIVKLEPVKDQIEDPSIENLLRSVQKFSEDKDLKSKIRKFLESKP